MPTRKQHKEPGYIKTEVCSGYGNLEGKIVTPQQAIRQWCLECQGGHALPWNMSDGKMEPPDLPYDAVRQCTATTCWLFPFRSGRNPYTKRKGNTDGLRAHREGLRSKQERDTST